MTDIAAVYSIKAVTSSIAVAVTLTNVVLNVGLKSF